MNQGLASLAFVPEQALALRDVRKKVRDTLFLLEREYGSMGI